MNFGFPQKAQDLCQFKAVPSFIPLVIIMFRKYDGGIRVCSRKTVLNRNIFLTTPLTRRRPQDVPLGCILKYSEALKQGTNTETGPKNVFEIASKKKALQDLQSLCHEQIQSIDRYRSGGYTHPVGFGRPAILHAPLPGPDGKSS